MYDVAIVSSAEIAKHYAEGFGLSDDKVLATGIPRTDIFMDPQYAQTVQNGFYAKYPQLRDKRIILFAPTFRGNGQMSAYYPADAFHVDEFMEALPADTALLIKYHPFCPERPVTRKATRIGCWICPTRTSSTTCCRHRSADHRLLQRGV